jgi:uncharacterized SAM-binding protein YcdF (DUF218 family)
LAKIPKYDNLSAMFYLIAKILEPLERPDDDLLLCLVTGMALLWFGKTRKTGIAITTLAVLTLALIALFSAPAWLSRPLENRFPRPRVWPSHVDGLIVLGGAVDANTTAKWGLPTLNGDAERMTEFVRLAKLYPSAALVFSGGATFLGERNTEASVARLFFQQQGIDLQRVIFEDPPRNTFENVHFTKAIVKPRPGQTWLLVQSAVMMPRTVGVFFQAGWPVLAVPVAYKTTAINKHLEDNLAFLDRAAHEWEGLIAYRLTGKIDVLFPSPSHP